MAWFYGWTDAEVRSMDYETSELYWHSITVIEAQSMLLDYSAQDFPHMNKEGRKKAHKKAYAMAYPKSLRQESPALSTRELMQKIAGLVNGG